jgi:hypothetical protein
MFNYDIEDTNEPKSRVLFENHQWQVTDFGVESIRPAPTYPIPADRLLEARWGRAPVYSFPMQMAQKTWVDIEAFIEAFEKALQLLADRIEGSVDPEKLTASIAKARQEAMRRHSFSRSRSLADEFRSCMKAEGFEDFPFCTDPSEDDIPEVRTFPFSDTLRGLMGKKPYL